MWSVLGKLAEKFCQGLIEKLVERVLAVLLTVTITEPELVPLATVAVKEVEVLAVTADIAVPFIVTEMEEDCVGKFDPEKVTTVPATPNVGEKVDTDEVELEDDDEVVELVPVVVVVEVPEERGCKLLLPSKENKSPESAALCSFCAFAILHCKNQKAQMNVIEKWKRIVFRIINQPFVANKIN